MKTRDKLERILRQPSDGPWTVKEYGYERYAILDPRGTDIAFAHRENDARLIAAAPELYEALELICDTYGFDSSTDSSIWQTAFAALSKARGEA